MLRMYHQQTLGQCFQEGQTKKQMTKVLPLVRALKHFLFEK
jgi:hypothetical protein